MESKSLERALASHFIFFSSLVNFWEDNFAWGTGKFSPKVKTRIVNIMVTHWSDMQVMIERQSRHLEGREGELVLQEESSEPLVRIPGSARSSLCYCLFCYHLVLVGICWHLLALVGTFCTFCTF